MCAVLGLSNPTVAVSRLDDDEFSNFNLGKGRPALIISESGLYDLIMQSRKTEAEAFKRWVRKDLLPAIRKDGGYIMGEEKLKSGEMSEDD